MEEAVRYDTLKPQIWAFTQKFRGKGFSKGDARAYLSLLAELVHLETGEDIVSALGWALEHAMALFRKGKGAVEEDYHRKYREWLDADRSKIDLKRFVPMENRVKAERYRPAEPVYSISLFTGAYGLDLGFEQAGFEATVGLDISEWSYRNFHANRPKSPFILGDINKISTEDILKEAGLRPGEVDVLTGGPPCQPFSTAGKRQGLNDPRASALMQYIRVIKEARPKVFVMEEVTGLLNARLKHVPIKERGKRPLRPEEEPGSVWKVVMKELEGTGYLVKDAVLNAADYGTPQFRERVIVIGVRPDIAKELGLTKDSVLHPRPTHTGPNRNRGRAKEVPLDEWLGHRKVGLPPWLTLAEAIADIEDHIGYIPLGPKYMRYIKYVPPGGNWRQIPDELKPEAMNSAYYAGGGKMGFYRRLTWFEPSPTLVTSPSMKATMMVHPLEDRPVSVREYLRIQGFPDDWKVVLSVSQAYKVFGEAVPVPLARAVALKVRRDILGVPDA
ncbi:DNA cytosine methyltransferase [Thermococcus sp. 18S1]|uniref:DNA cytosine methyltransferase n=1 Tax=Thermococcus sp. 18S1 TaxID=1638210 RepID=UPI00143C5B87|nr:DNA cytosine methyltransferase [Thermococcus sp. 18S1]NJE30607.1 DNA cytosine methyltransferase [Thermococcus sp. 18S1]